MATPSGRLRASWEHLFLVLGIAFTAWGWYWGLVVAPPDRFMGDVMRILYVHVPAAWVTMLSFTVVFVAGMGWLGVYRNPFRSEANPPPRWHWDALTEAAIEVGLVYGALLVCLGSLWARPTWGVWWTWDPRLTSVAVMMLSFAGVAALRAFVDDPRQRATWSAVASVVAYVDVPIVYFSVRWWNSLHQVQSGKQAMDDSMHDPLMVNSLAMLFLFVWMLARRYRIARNRLDEELSPCPE